MPAEPILLTRRLTTVLLADVVGYSRMMSRDEDSAYARIARYTRELVQPAVDQHHGHIVRSLGDGMLIEFGSALSAVHCALVIQRGLRERQTGDPERFQLRMGINTGDVLVDERDIHEHIINITARLEGLAEPGTVYISQGIYDQTRCHPDLFFADKGLSKVKNIDHPIHAYQVSDVPIPVPSLATKISSRPGLLSVTAVTILLAVSGAAWLPDRGPVAAASSTSVMPANSIVVLPFRNLGGKPEEEYLADAITDDISTDLSRLQRAVVIASATALSYKNKPSDVRQIGREVGARFVLEGSVKRAGPAVQVNAQLIDAQTGTHLWANRFTHETTSLIDLQDAITGRIAATLNVQLVQVQRRREVGTFVADGNPLDERLRAMATMAGPGFDADKSLETQQRVTAALEFYPELAELLAVLANLLVSDYLNGWNKAGLPEVDRAEEAANKAVRLDRSQPVANYALGMIYRVRGKHDRALAAFDAAIERNPNFARAHAQRANELVFLGNTKDAIVAARKAITHSPKDPSIGVFYWVIGRAHFVDADWGNAIEWLGKSARERRNLWFNQAWLMAAYVMNGQPDKAQALVDEFRRTFPTYTLARITDIYKKETRHQGLNEQTRTTLLRGLAEIKL